MYVVSIDSDQCTGCGQCAAACPSQIITVVEHKAQVSGDSSECLGCESCTALCEPGAVTVQEY
jgi:Fe-S-cluster-containing hydrogenase component 2